MGVHREIEKYFDKEIEDSKTFLRDLARGSHDLIDLSFYLEKRLKFSFPGDEWNTVKTVGQVCRLIESITGKKKDNVRNFNSNTRRRARDR
jgi:acyl carrier protein